MSEQQRALKGIRGAAKRRAKAETDRRKATNDLRDYCKAAKEASVPITEIAREAGLSRQGVYDLLGERPSP